MKQRFFAMAVVLALTLSLVTAANNLTPGASPYSGAQPPSPANAGGSPTAVETVPAATQPYAAKPTATFTPTGGTLSISFDNIESMMRELNPTIKANKESLGGVKDAVELGYMNQYLSLNAQMAGLSSQLKALSGMSSDPALQNYISAQITSINGSLQGLEVQKNRLNDAEEDDDAYDRAKHQFAAADDQLCMGAQTYYLSILSMEASLADMNRSLAALNRTVTTMEKQLSLGLVSEMDVLGVKQQRSSLQSTADTLQLNLSHLKQDLALMLGGTAQATVTVVPLPVLSSYTLSKMNYTNDLAGAKKNSFTLWQKQVAIYDASDADIDGQLRAAKINMEAARESTELSFRKLYDAVGEKNRLLAVAENTLSYQAQQFEVQKLKHERGMISDNEWKDAEDALAAAQSAVDAAKVNLYTVYNQYQWAVRGIMG